LPVDSKGRITIPSSIRKSFGIKEGDQLKLFFDLKEGLGVKFSNNNKNEKKEIYDRRIIEAMPSLAGVTPAGNTEKMISNVLNGLTDGERSNIVSMVELVKNSAENVGLKVTVNDLQRTVNAMKKISKSNIGKETGIELIFPQIYKGVSYNPSTMKSNNRREWIMLLDFFSLMKEIIEESKKKFNSLPPKIAVFDASFYWTVNLLGKDGIKIKAENSEEASKQIISFLKKAVKDKKFKQVYEVARTRNAYLRTICSKFPANNTPPVFTLLDIWNDEDFQSLFKTALDLFCSRDNKGDWYVKNPINYERYMQYSPWVTPLVAAEQGLMAKKYGFRANLAPTTEAAWNKIIDRICRKINTPSYVIWTYARGLASEMPYEKIPFFSDNKKILKEKLFSEEAVKNGLSELVIRLISPFNGGNEKRNKLLKYLKNDEKEKLVNEVYKFISEVDYTATRILKNEKTIPEIPLTNTGWLMVFPPGTC